MKVYILELMQTLDGHESWGDGYEFYGVYTTRLLANLAGERITSKDKYCSYLVLEEDLIEEVL